MKYYYFKTNINKTKIAQKLPQPFEFQHLFFFCGTDAEECKTLTEMVDLPPSALQGLAGWADAELAKAQGSAKPAGRCTMGYLPTDFSHGVARIHVDALPLDRWMLT